MTNEERQPSADTGNEKPTITLPGRVEKVIPPIDPQEPGKEQIAIEGAEDLYREIRVLKDPSGADMSLKPMSPRKWSSMRRS